MSGWLERMLGWLERMLRRLFRMSRLFGRMFWGIGDDVTGGEDLALEIQDEGYGMRGM